MNIREPQLKGALTSSFIQVQSEEQADNMQEEHAVNV